MKEMTEKKITEIKLVANRIQKQIDVIGYNYYNEMPSAVKKEIYNWLEAAVIQTEALIFYTDTRECDLLKDIVEVKRRYNVNTIYECLDKVVNKTLKYYNVEFVSLVTKVICSLKNKLVKAGYDIHKEYEYLSNRLELANCISLHEDKYPVLLKLQKNISAIRKVNSIRPGCLVPEVHELYGVNALLLELEENIKLIETIKEEGYINIILEYINSFIDWKWFEEIRQ